MNDKTLVQRLRDRHVCSIAQNSCRNDYICEEAATRIEALEAEKANAADALTTLSARVETLEAALREVFLHGHGEGWRGNQTRRDVQHVDAEKSWSLYVSNGALSKTIARQALAGDDHGHR